ncbi:dihydrolipoyllysine-residue succinyltransferase [Lewinellaceae bacterium SD302]|nr:dihydrolipoyllysine-residue succinyltransferase [Lewinellaceae bacterium SD302]
MAIVELKVPVIGESVTEVTLSQWLKENGDMIALDEPICEFESDKATLEFPSEAAGKLIYVAEEGDDLEIGALVAKIDTEAAGEAAPAESAAAKEEKPDNNAKTEAGTEGEVNATEGYNASKENYATGTPSPAAAKILREKGVDAANVNGTGRDGRITKADAQDAKAAPAPSKKAESPTADTATLKSAPAAFSREQRTEKMSRMRRTIASRLVKAKNETAMLTTFNEVDLSAVMALRKKVQERFVEKNGVKLGFMSLFAKACAKVLMDMPNVNAQLGENGKELIYHDYVDISFAISTPTGLVVPPVKNVESISFADVEIKLKELAKKARNNELTIEEMQGGTFTITNGGVFGSMMSTPIINEPQSAILGMHNIIQRPVAVNGEVVIRPMMYIALSYDHRVIDGSSSVTFLVKVKELLEDPEFLLLSL